MAVVVASVSDSAAADMSAVSSIQFSHEPGAGANKVLYVFVGVEETTPDQLDSVVYNTSEALTRLGFIEVGVTSIEVWRLINPSAGPANVVITAPSAQWFLMACAITVTGAHQTTPEGTPETASGTGATITDDGPSAVDELVLAAAATFGSISAVGADQTSLSNLNPDADGAFRVSSEPGAATVTSSFTGTAGEPWVLISVSVQPAEAEAYDQYGYRFYEDDDVEGSATPLATQNNPADVAIEGAFRLRIGVDTNGEDPPSEALTLQYRLVGSGSGEWHDIGA